MSMGSGTDSFMHSVLKKIEEIEKELSNTDQTDEPLITSSVLREDPTTLAGFDYCFRETLDYLINQERLDFDHPLVKSLLLYLVYKRKEVVGCTDTSNKENLS